MEQMHTRKRSQARMLALQALCTLEAVGDSFRSELPRFLADDENRSDLGFADAPDEEMLRFARVLADGAWTDRKALDARLEKSAAHWSLARMTPVDRNLLRLGLYELINMPDTPAAVVVNEAIELAKLFSDTESPAFVNGILDAVRRELAANQASTTILPK